MPSTEIVPLQKDVPEEVDVDFYDLDGAKRLKRLKRDNLLPDYYVGNNDYGDGVVRVGEADEIGEPLLEKKADSREELEYHILAYELGVAPEPYGFQVREEGDGDNIYYFMEFLTDFGMFEDLDFDGLNDFLDYTHSVAQAYAPLWQAGIMHNDLVRTAMSSDAPSEYVGTPYLANVMVAGSDDVAMIIDMEDAEFEEMSHHPENLLTTVRENSDEEYADVLAAIQSEAVRSLEERIEEDWLDEGELDVDSIFDFNAPGNNTTFNPADDIDPDLANLFQEIRESFKDGIRQGRTSPSTVYDNARLSTIDVEDEGENVPEAARKRFEEIQRFVEENI